MSWMDLVQKNIKRWWKERRKPISPSTEESATCLNCQTTLDENANYCPQCGQKKRPARLSIFEMLEIGLNTIIGYDTRLWRTLRHIFSPAKLPNMFQTGKRRSILHPLRLFFFLFLLVALVYFDNTQDFFISSRDSNSLQLNIQNEEDILDEIEDEPTFRTVYVFVTMDSLCPEYIPTEIIRKAQTESELFELSGLPDDFNHLFARKQLKFYWDRKSYARFITDNLIWVILLIQPFLALFLKIILFRHYFSDHLSFALFTHSSIFFMLLVSKLLFIVSDWLGGALHNPLLILLIGAFLLFLLLSVRRFYQKSWTRSIMILCYIGITYLIVAFLALAINLMAGFLFF